MTITLTATETKAKLLALLEQVAGGEEVLVTKHGRVIARIVPAGGGHALRNKFAGVVRVADPDDDLLSTGLEWEIERA